MQLSEAISMIKDGISSPVGNWADIGAGTGLFTQALGYLLEDTANIYAVDKNPHSLYNLYREVDFNLHIVDGDFNRPLDVPQLDGIVMANALHYAKNKQEVLQNILSNLKNGGDFILIEYDTDRPVPIWVPHPIPFRQFLDIAAMVGLSTPQIINERPSIYGNGMIYTAHCKKHY